MPTCKFWNIHPFTKLFHETHQRMLFLLSLTDFNNFTTNALQHLITFTTFHLFHVFTIFHYDFPEVFIKTFIIEYVFYELTRSDCFGWLVFLYFVSLLTMTVGDLFIYSLSHQYHQQYILFDSKPIQINNRLAQEIAHYHVHVLTITFEP